MKTEKMQMQYWIKAGYKIGRLEFIWGSKFQEAQQVFDSSRREILSMMRQAQEVFEIDETSFRTFSESILFHFMYKNPEIYGMILIGICIQRMQFSNGLTNMESKEKIKKLSRSALNGVPNALVKDKEYLFSIIFLNREKAIEEIASVVWDSLQEDNENKLNTINNVKPEVCNNKPYLFISYSSIEHDIALKLRLMLEEMGIACWMAPESIPVGGDYSQVIVDAIEKSAGVVLVLSQNSQTSQWVPKELDIAITAEKIIFPIHIDQSSIIKKIHFRLTDSQVVEAYGCLDEAFAKMIRDIKKVL